MNIPYDVLSFVFGISPTCGRDILYHGDEATSQGIFYATI